MKKDYSNIPIHYSTGETNGNKLYSVLCRPATYKYAKIGKEYLDNIEQQRNIYKWLRDCYRCIGVYTNNKKEVTCKQCLKKMNPKTTEIKELKYNIQIIKGRLRCSYKTIDKQQKELERLYKQIEIVTGVELKRCDRCAYFEDWNNQIYRCVNPLLGWNVPPYFLKNVSTYIDIANKNNCFCKKENNNDKTNTS